MPLFKQLCSCSISHYNIITGTKYKIYLDDLVRSSGHSKFLRTRRGPQDTARSSIRTPARSLHVNFNAHQTHRINCDACYAKTNRWKAPYYTSTDGKHPTSPRPMGSTLLHLDRWEAPYYTSTDGKHPTLPRPMESTYTTPRPMGSTLLHLDRREAPYYTSTDGKHPTTPRPMGSTLLHLGRWEAPHFTSTDGKHPTTYPQC